MVVENTMAHTIGGRIRALRDERDVSQLKLGEALNISTSALRNLEYGNALPSLKTLVLLSDFFGVSIDYIVRGVTPGDGGGLDIYRATGLNDMSMVYLGEQIDIGKNCGGLDEYIASLNALVSNNMLALIWSLNRLNRELVKIDAQIKKILADTPEPNGIIEEMALSGQLEPLCEQRDILRLRYLRHVERVFAGLIVKGEEAD